MSSDISMGKRTVELDKRGVHFNSIENLEKEESYTKIGQKPKLIIQKRNDGVKRRKEVTCKS